jgi:hypothetical protein
MTIEEFTKRCPVEVGDYFYRKRPNETIPDRLEVIEIKEVVGGYFIRAKYIYHSIGPNLERTFSDIIFKDPAWVIEKRGTQV